MNPLELDYTELLHIRTGLVNFLNAGIKGTRVGFLVSDNLDRIQKKIKIANESLEKDPPEFKQYQEELFKLSVKHTNYSMSDFPQRRVNSEYILERKAFLKERQQLDEKYQDTLDEKHRIDQANDQKVEQLTDLPVEVIMIPLDLLPEDLDSAITHGIRKLIDYQSLLDEVNPSKKTQDKSSSNGAKKARKPKKAQKGED